MMSPENVGRSKRGGEKIGRIDTARCLPDEVNMCPSLLRRLESLVGGVFAKVYH
ncbi:hypothetical protein PAXRUDRAFT_826451 [Paxillus rubicundulus Ve08.2h10]|uniref:Uncharacterized protein n=1 Tax=Paxillus rubicundulus Ve08.2h10 TaxID=930991 RepID=A0A0D0DS06_9AGAM|nr:hypothetical protein PAXRUDRAFT_826451 [Paxillus rubicundulus Ve08.2h10]